MTLKRQLLIASLLMLLIPWAGLRFVLELDQALREQAVEQLGDQARRLERVLMPVLADYPAPPAHQPVIYARALQRAPAPDGYGADWPGYDDETGQPEWSHTSQEVFADGEDSGHPSRHPLSWQAGVFGQHLYLLIGAGRQDLRLFSHGDPDQPHDLLRLQWQQDGRRFERYIRATGPGEISSDIPGQSRRSDNRVTGQWQDTGAGTLLELKLPRPDWGSPIAFDLVTSQPGRMPDAPLQARLITPLPTLQQSLEPMISSGEQAQVLDTAGWILASAEQTPTGTGPDFDSLGPMEIIEQISLNGLRALVRLFQPEPRPLGGNSLQIEPDTLPPEGLVRHNNGALYLIVTRPLEDGRTLLLQQSMERILALSGNALGSVIARSTLLLIGLMLVLLGYASWLSFRITRLQRAVNNSVDEDGRIRAALPASGARDELGELSRHFARMVERQQGYTDYLENFSRRLSHELKTPVAVVRSSLENLGQPSTAEEQTSYLARARSATDRLSRILQSMSEASRLEQSLDHAEKEPFDLAPVVAEASAAYQALDPAHRIDYRGPVDGCRVNGSPELLVQLLDKLVDNARDFTPEGGQILVELEAGSRNLTLSVFNQGSRLPPGPGQDIFSPFVSVRSSEQEGHLGQGLLIVRLIADHHHGHIQAANDSVDGQPGVRFSVHLPAR